MFTTEQFKEAEERIRSVVRKTPLQYVERLSEKYGASVYLKREDLQTVRSYKIRGAYNLIASLSDEEKKRGVVCASAGNHAQGFAYSCSKLGVKGVVYMPEVSPRQKINKVKFFGGSFVEVRLVGATFDEANSQAKEFCEMHDMVFVHPFDDERTILGQGTVGVEIFDELPDVEVVVMPIGGGGLSSGVSSYLKSVKKDITLFGADPKGAAKLVKALDAGAPVLLETIDTFVDGAAVKRIGEKTFRIVRELLDGVHAVPEGKVCTTMIELYQNEGIIAEPAGALSVAALDFIKEEIAGKTVVCILSGGNNDIMRYPEIMERSLVYEGIKHYFVIEFAQKPGQLKKFLEQALGPNDDIVRFEYLKKTNKEFGAALVGIELSDKNDYESLLRKMDGIGLKYKVLNTDELLYQFVV